MPISEKTYKIIWGQFSGRCCLCKREVIHVTEGGVTSLTGEVAHIVGESEDAARGRATLSLKERNDPDNLMLLCREHHKIVDDDPTTYTVEDLHDKKQAFLDWIVARLGSAQPWRSNLSQLVYINVPRLCEQAELKGYRVDLSKYRDDKTLHSLGWDLNHIMSAFQVVLAHLEVQAIPVHQLRLHEGHIGAPLSFDRVRFRTKNIALDAMYSAGRWNQQFSGNLEKDPHIYAKFGDFRLVIFIDANWITTSTAFTLFKPSSGQSTFSGLGRITNVDYENRVITATAWVIGLPRGPLDELLSEKPAPSTSASVQASNDYGLDALVDMDTARRRKVFFLPPPIHYDLCQRPLAVEKYMIDGGVKGQRFWACMCSACFATNGRGIGWGVGQLYLRDQDGWLEVAGFGPS